jgi:nondiscriminating aspartyl-tRNA synthetase
MQRTLIQFIKNNIGQTVQINGWIDTIRQLKKMWFIVVRDHTGVIQVTYTNGQNEKIDALIAMLTSESTVEIIGKVVKNDYVKLKGMEIIPEEIKIINLSEPELPIDTTSSQETCMDFRFLDLRRPHNTLIFRVQSALERAMREYWYQKGFMEIHSPKLMNSPSESGAEVFRLEYYDRFAYLAQSPQFYKQMAMAAGFDRVFEIGPVFRANPSYTSRHETEFVGIDMEMSWIHSHEDIMVFQEQWLKYAIETVKKELGQEILDVLGLDLQVPTVPFPRITMREAHEMLKKLGHPLADEEDLDPEGERLLYQHILETQNHEFVFVTLFPVPIRPFYHLRPENDPTVTNSYDLLWKGLEVTTGAQREHRYDILVKQVIEKGLSPESIQDYLNYFKFGCPPHGGFGTGLARIMMSLLGLKNIREAVFLSRSPNRLAP